MRLVQACSCARRTFTTEEVDACVSARANRESSFHRSGGPVMLVHACLCAVKT